jgi:hypothetical protein
MITLAGIVHPPGDADTEYTFDYRKSEFPKLSELLVNKPILDRHKLIKPKAIGRVT